jgi:hypothetical protein
VEAVEEHLDPADNPPGAQDEAETPRAAPEPYKEGESSEGDEERELKRAYPSTEWPSDQ